MTNPAQLRRRVRRAANQIREQHERISPLFAHLDAVLIEGNLRDAQTTAFRLQGALRAHFLLEEQIVFPVLSALCPDRADELGPLEEDHTSLESDFAALIDLILATALQTAGEALHTFTLVLLEHESREEILLNDAIETES
jgi:iron-sulfur cluster repair protein YtfE (RIC family)